MNYLMHFNKNHSAHNGQFTSGDGDGDGVVNDHYNIKRNRHMKWRRNGDLTSISRPIVKPPITKPTARIKPTKNHGKIDYHLDGKRPAYRWADDAHETIYTPEGKRIYAPSKEVVSNVSSTPVSNINSSYVGSGSSFIKSIEDEEEKKRKATIKKPTKNHGKIDVQREVEIPMYRKSDKGSDYIISPEGKEYRVKS